MERSKTWKKKASAEASVLEARGKSKQDMEEESKRGSQRFGGLGAAISSRANVLEAWGLHKESVAALARLNASLPPVDRKVPKTSSPGSSFKEFKVAGVQGGWP